MSAPGSGGLRYVVVALGALSLDVALMALATQGLGMPWLPALLMSATSAQLAGYLAMKAWVFDPARKGFQAREFGAFCLVAVGAIAINAAVMGVLVDLLQAPVMPSRAAAIMTAFFPTYRLRKWVVEARPG